MDLPPEQKALLTTDDREASLHVVPLWMISQQHMVKLLKHYRGRFSTGESSCAWLGGACNMDWYFTTPPLPLPPVVGFKPTGWTHDKSAGQTRARGRKQQRGTVITYQVPYSEHSSFSEPREFVRWFQPLRIVPSVNSDSHGPKERSLVDLLTKND